jgi:hypothetical protein
MAPGCPEKFDLEFLGYLLTFRARLRPAIVSALAGYEGMLVAARSPADVNALEFAVSQASATGSFGFR